MLMSVNFTFILYEDINRYTHGIIKKFINKFIPSQGRGSSVGITTGYGLVEGVGVRVPVTSRMYLLFHLLHTDTWPIQPPIHLLLGLLPQGKAFVA
jgi:hypothetical protein